MLVTLVGTEREFRAGEEVTVSAATAGRFIDRGYAVPVREPEVERAVVEPSETAGPKPRRRTRRKSKDDVGQA